MRTLLAVVVSITALVASAGPDWWKGTLTVDNDSDYAVHHLYVTPAHKVSWGKDWLGKDVLFPHEFAVLTGLACDEYDIKLVDDEGDVCIVEDVDFCLQDAHWHLTNKELASCSGFEK